MKDGAGISCHTDIFVRPRFPVCSETFRRSFEDANFGLNFAARLMTSRKFPPKRNRKPLKKEPSFTRDRKAGAPHPVTSNTLLLEEIF